MFSTSRRPRASRRSEGCFRSLRFSMAESAYPHFFAATAE
jgi:hypothetical protein